MDYLLKASGIVIILFLFYTLFLKNETYFKSIRGYFLAGLIIVVSIPLIEIPVYIETISNQLNQFNFEEITTNQIVLENTFDWLQVITFLYLIGVAIFSARFLIQLISLLALFSKHSFIKKGNFYFIETTKDISPFSFFNIIIYNKSQFIDNELEQIINHEKAHVLQWHSLDTILAHLLVITLWFNPFVWLYKKAVQQNLEFLADSYAIQLAENQQLYQFTLLKTCSVNYRTEITNNFYNSLIKKRIIMIHKNKSTNKSQWKYLLLVPIFIAFVMTFNTKAVAQEKQLVKVEKMKTKLIIDKNSTDASLAQETATFKSDANIKLTFKGIKRNTNNEIISIKIEAKGENVKAKFENSGTNPIEPIKISWDSENNSVNIGNISKNHENNFTYDVNETGGTYSISKKGKKETYIITKSGEETTSSTSHSTDTIVHKNKIIIKSHGDEDNVWVSKNAHDGNVKLIASDDVENIKIEIIKSDNDKSENVFIIKEDSDAAIEHKSENVMVFSDSSNGEPIFILDGKEISKEEMEKINPDKIESINVLKGESATKKYGEKGKNGVIVITKQPE